MKLKIAQVIGLNTDQKAAQAASSIREDNTFLGILELTCDDAFTKGRQALSELEDFYFEFEGTIPEKLNAAFKEAESKFSKGADFSLILAAIFGKVLYIIGKGQVETYLKRADKLSSLSSVGMSSQLISGFLQDGDRLLFTTKSLVTFLGDDLGKSLSLPVDMFEDEVGSKIGTSDLEDQGLSALAIEITEENPEIASLSTLIPPAFPTKPLVSFQAILGKAMKLLSRLRACFPKNGRGRLVVALVLIVIIAVGAGYQYKLSRDQKIKMQFTQALQEAKDNFNNAKGLSALNPNEAKSKLDLAKDKINQALALKPKDADAQQFRKQIEEESPKILQEASVADFPVFLDMDLVKKNFRATSMSLSKDKLLLLDQEVKTAVVVDLTKKSNQILAGAEQLGEAQFGSLNGGLAFIYSKDKGILKIDITNSKLSVVSKKDTNFGQIKDIYGFAGNIYLLDTVNQVWKFLPTADGYSDAREYLSKDTKADFSNALRMQIESSVYILKTGGEILRFTKGEKDNFSLGGLPSAVKDPKSIFTSSDTDNLYLLDPGNSRLLILTKTGSYKGQLTGSKFATATDLVVDEVGKKVYLLEGGKIYSVDLK